MDPQVTTIGNGVRMREARAARDADFEAWMSLRQPALLRTAYLLTGELHTAEDLLQTTFAKLYLAWDRIRDREHIDAYARRTLINEHRSLWRRPFKRREVLAERLPETALVGDGYDGTRDAMWAFVNTLPPKQRAVIVPTTLLLQNRATEAPALPLHSSTPSPTPTVNPSPTKSPHAEHHQKAPTLASVPRGPDTHITYLDTNGQVHSAGSTAALPGKTTGVLSFSAYHGGWLVIDGNGVLHQYDGRGHQVAQGKNGSIALSSDQTQTAFQMGSTVRMGISTGMGEGEQTWTAPPDAMLVGMLPTGPVAVGTRDTTVLRSGGKSSTLPLSLVATTTSEATNLVGGLTGSVAKDDFKGAVADAKTGKVLWQNEWRPLRFSDDGKYVAAAPAADNGDPSAIAVLDARTGEVVAKTPELATGVFLGWKVAWDDDQLVFEADGDKGRQDALLALDTRGRLTRVSDVMTVPAGATAFTFAAQP